MRPVLLASLALLAQSRFATCGRAPATGTTYDCPDGTAFTVNYTDSTTALLTLDDDTRRLSSKTKPATSWTDSTVTLSRSGDTATVSRGDTAVRRGCVLRNPELHRGA